MILRLGLFDTEILERSKSYNSYHFFDESISDKIEVN